MIQSKSILKKLSFRAGGPYMLALEWVFPLLLHAVTVAVPIEMLLRFQWSSSVPSEVPMMQRLYMDVFMHGDVHGTNCLASHLTSHAY